MPADAWAAREEDGWVVPGATDAGEPSAPEAEPTNESLLYARELVNGVQEHGRELDRLIARYADRWAIERMPVVDRTLLRIALYELGWRKDVPVPVVINEAVELAKALSTEDSGRFINGLLGRVVEQGHL